MKIFTALLGLGLLFVPAIAPAQMPPPGTPQPALASHYRQLHERMEKIHRTERTQVLAALTPAHRALVANLVGGLAISANPDPKAAAAKLDAALSPAEKSAVLKIHATAMSQMHDLMHQMMAQRPGGATQPPPQSRRHARHRPSAGQLVLEIAAAGTHPHEMMFFPGPGGMRHFHRPKPNPTSTPNPSST